MIGVSIVGVGVGVAAMWGVNQLFEPCPIGRSCSSVSSGHGPSDFAYVAAGLGGHLATMSLLAWFAHPADDEKEEATLSLYPRVDPQGVGLVGRLSLR
jgi:hypothetical protein